MTFEEIKKIDRGPDYEMYSDSVVDYSTNGPSFNLYYYIMLLVLYMKKFDETYGTEFYLRDNMESLFRYAGDYEIEDTFYDEVFSFEYKLWTVLSGLLKNTDLNHASMTLRVKSMKLKRRRIQKKN